MPSGLGSPRLAAHVLSAQDNAQLCLPAEVRGLVDTVFSEASQRLGSTITTPFGAISVEQVEKAEAVLFAIKRAIDRGESGNKVRLAHTHTHTHTQTQTLTHTHANTPTHTHTDLKALERVLCCGAALGDEAHQES